MLRGQGPGHPRLVLRWGYYGILPPLTYPWVSAKSQQVCCKGTPIWPHVLSHPPATNGLRWLHPQGRPEGLSGVCAGGPGGRWTPLMGLQLTEEQASKSHH